jgi:transposase-like protein
MTIEVALGVEMEHHLACPKHGQGNSSDNTRNGYYPKIVKDNHREVVVTFQEIVILILSL